MSTNPTITLETTVNGKTVTMEIEPRTMLLDFLRDDLGLTGAKRSCDVQVCGSCTVLLDGQPVSACCTLAYEAHNRDVLTIEGVADGDTLHPVQQAFLEEYGLQCGYCTSGMVLTTLALLEDNPTPDEATVRGHLSGNLCRCTGYYPILKAVQKATEKLAEGGV